MANNELLGKKVKFTHELRRVRKPEGRREWEEVRVAPPGYALNVGIEGVIVGERTVSDGYAEGGYDEARGYSATAHRNVWLVSYDMRRKPVLVPKDEIVMAEAF